MTPTYPFQPFFDEIRKIIREVIREEIGSLVEKQSKSKDWLTAKECAELYSLPPTWFEERGRAGQIARCKPGRYVLFAKHDIEQYLEAHKGKKTV